MKPENERLPEEVVALLTPFFPELDLSRIRVCEGIPRYVVGDPVGYADRYRIYFAPGVYRVDTIEGLALIAHEVAHCLQYQRHGAVAFSRPLPRGLFQKPPARDESPEGLSQHPVRDRSARGRRASLQGLEDAAIGSA